MQTMLNDTRVIAIGGKTIFIMVKMHVNNDSCSCTHRFPWNFLIGVSTDKQIVHDQLLQELFVILINCYKDHWYRLIFTRVAGESNGTEFYVRGSAMVSHSLRLVSRKSMKKRQAPKAEAQSTKSNELFGQSPRVSSWCNWWRNDVPMLTRAKSIKFTLSMFSRRVFESQRGDRVRQNAASRKHVLLLPSGPTCLHRCSAVCLLIVYLDATLRYLYLCVGTHTQYLCNGSMT